MRGSCFLVNRVAEAAWSYSSWAPSSADSFLSMRGTEVPLKLSSAVLLWESPLEAQSRTFSFFIPKNLKFIAVQSHKQSPKPKRFVLQLAEVDFVLCNQIQENHLPVLIQTSDPIIHLHVTDNVELWEKEVLLSSFF